MNKVFKVLNISLVLLFVFLGLSFNVNANDYTEVLVGGDAEKYGRYSVKENIAENDLAFGVYHRTDISTTAAGVGMITHMGSAVSEKFVPGKEYPQQVNIMEVSPDDNVKIVSWSILGKTSWSLNTVKAMANDYEKVNPGYKVIGAINADFFDINSKNPLPKSTQGAHVAGGEFYKSTSGSTVGFTNDGTSNSFVAGIPTRTSKPILAIYNSNDEIIKEYQLNQVNKVPTLNEVSVFYPYWTMTDGVRNLVTHEVDNGYIIGDSINSLGYSVNDFYGKGYITSFASKEIKEGEFSIVSNNSEITNLLDKGVKVRVQYEYTGQFENITDATGAGANFLIDSGVPVHNDSNRHPRTVIGKKEDGTIVMAVVDGRQPASGMYGATHIEIASIMKHYGAVEAYNLDGGGSSTMAILKDGELVVVNSPSDGIERTDANCLLIVAKVPVIEYEAVNELNEIKINANIINDNGYDLSNLYAKINNQYLKVDKEVIFNNLESNTRYALNFYTKIGDDYIDIAVQSIEWTRKITPTVKSIYLYYDQGILKALINMDDPHFAIDRNNIIIGNKSTIINNGSAVFLEHPDSLTSIRLSTSINLNDGNGRVEVNLEYNLSVENNLLIKIVSEKINKKLKNIIG